MGVGGAVGYVAAPGKVQVVTERVASRTPYGGTVRIGVSSEAAVLNPFFGSGDVNNMQLVGNVFNTLVNIDRNGNFVPELATSWWQPDPLTWRFNLREGVQFHKDYGELTADDVAWTVNTIIQEKKPQSFLFGSVKGAEVLDKYLVQYNLSAPFGPFLATAIRQGSNVISKKAYTEKGEAAFGRDPVGTGPFEFVEWKSGDHITLKKFDKYWREGKPFLDELVWRPIPDTLVKQTMLRTGELDIIDRPLYKDIGTLSEEKSIRVDSIPGWNWDYLAFRVRPDATNDVNAPTEKGMKLRQAISYAIDRQQIAKEIYYGYATPTDIPFPPGFLGRTGEDPGHYYPMNGDLDKAKQLLNEAGYPNGFEISCITSDKQNLRQELELVQAQLKRVGITLSIQTLDMAGFITKWDREGSYEMLDEDITVMTPDPDATIYWFYHEGSWTYPNNFNPDVDKLLEGERQSSDPEERKRLLRQILDMVIPGSKAVDPFQVYLVHVQVINILNRKIVNFQPQPDETKFMFEDVMLIQEST